MRIIFLILLFMTSWLVSFSQCVPTPGVEAITNGDFENGYVGSSTFGELTREPLPTPGGYSNPGEYAIGTNPNNFSLNNPVFYDHTKKNGTGSMLMIDGPLFPQDTAAVWQQQVHIFSNQTYYFSAWVTSMFAADFPILQFEVKGNNESTWTLLGSPISPSLVGIWQQFFQTWYSGTDTAATLRLVDSEGQQWGNDFALDDISFINSCQNVNAGAKPLLPSSISLCDHGGKVDLNTQINKVPQITFTWFKDSVQLPNTTNILTNITQTGTYTVCVDSANCIQKDTSTVIAILNLDLGPDQNLCSPSYTYLNSNLANTTGLGLAWYKNDIIIPGDDSTNLFVSTPGDYKLIVTDLVGNNCNASDSVNITTSAPIPHDTTYCFIKGQTNSSISITGTGAFGWFTAATGGKKVGQGNSFTVTGLTGQDTTLWVKDTTTFSKIVGYSRNTSYGPSNTNNAADNTMLFTANDNFTIDSISFNLYSPTGKSGWTGKNLSIALIDKNTNVTVSAVLPIVVTGTNLIFSSQGGNEIEVRLAINLSVLSGHKYSFSAIGEGDVEGQPIPGSRLTYPLNDGQIVFTGYGTGSTDIWPGFYNWMISYGTNCDPVPVRVLEKCPLDCTQPTQPSLSPANTNFCGTGIQVLTAACSNSSAATFLYSFYRIGIADTSIVQTASGNRQYTATKTGTYYAVITDQTDTTLCHVRTPNAMITINPLPTADAGKDTTICKGITVVLTASGGTTYQWDNGLGAGSTQNVSPTTNTVYNVTVSDTNGCTASNSVEVYVNDCKCPSVQTKSVSPLCLYNAEISLDTITVTTEPGSWTITSYPAGSNPGTISNKVFNAIGKDTGAYELTFTLNTVPLSGCAKFSKQIIRINPLPMANAGMNDSICKGQTSVLTASATGSQGYIYLWSEKSSTGSMLTISPSVTNTYTVTVQDNNGCTDASAVVIKVNPLPTPDITATKSTICPGNSATIRVSGGISYLWQGESTADTLIVSPVINQTYLVTVTNIYGCKQDTSKTIDISSVPSPHIIGSAIICNGASEVLSVNGSDNYLWSTTQTISSITISPTMQTTYLLMASNSNGCTGTDQLVVNVNSLPVANAGQQQSICFGNSTMLTAIGGNQYQWNTNDTTSVITVKPSVGTTYIVTVTDKNDCSATSDVIVNINELPAIPEISDTLICLNETRSVTLTLKNPVTSYRYEWYGSSGGNDSLKQGTSYTVNNISQTDTVYIKSMTASGCTDRTREPVIITVGEIPTASFNYDPEQIIQHITTVNFHDATIINKSLITNWIWFPGDSTATLNGKNVNHIYNNPGQYVVMLVTENNDGCKDTTTKIIKVLPMDTINIPNVFTPNNDGINDYFYIKGIEYGEWQLIIYNRWGRKVYESNHYDNNLNKWTGEGCSDGVYFYVLRNATENKQTKTGYIELIR